MAEQISAPEGDLNQVARIVSSYVRHHQLGPEQLVELIKQVHRQGLRMKDAGEDLLHVSVIPCGHFATPLEAGL